MIRELIKWLLSLFGGEPRERKTHEVGAHKRSQAYGPKWSKRKGIKVKPYKRAR